MAFPSTIRVLTVAFILGVGFGLVTQPRVKAATEETEPSITKIRGKVITVTVPEGYQRISLQQLVSPRKGKAGGKGSTAAVPEWRTVATKYPEGASGQFTFRLSKLVGKRNLRVVGSRGEGVPDSLLTDVTEFEADPEGFKIDGTAPTSLGTPVFSDGSSSLDAVSLASFSTNGGASAAATREVVESDIWKVAGDRLFFFNQSRGFQVFDIQNPDDPALLGTLRVAGRGDQMYLLGNDHAVLLARQNRWYWYTLHSNSQPLLLTNNATQSASVSATSSFAAEPLSLSVTSIAYRPILGIILPYYNAQGENEVIVARAGSAAPSVVSRVPYTGDLVESRLVGKVLYLVTSTYQQTPGTNASVYGSKIVSIDLANPEKPIERASIFVPGWGHVVTATDRFLFVSKWDYNGNSAVDVIDISSPVGAIAKHAPVEVKGSINDKFKLNLEGDVLTVVSTIREQRVIGNVSRVVPITLLTNYSLANPDAPLKKGSIELAPGETVRATRFDNGRAYIVTFVQIDPLWIVDLQNPSEPKVLGHVEVPGFSTYIEPLGDRLVTIGQVDSNPAVSLFDVSNPAEPKVLSQVSIGDGKWSSSEATWNEKAFNVVPEANLILVPYHDYSSGIQFGVQILDLFQDKVVKRGVIKSDFTPRRATLHKERVISISNRNLLSVDVTDRDKPQVTADIEIAWPVDRVLLAGDYLVQTGYSYSPYYHSLSISPANNPDDSLAVVDLGRAYILGAEIKDGVLYVAQAPDYSVVPSEKTPGTNQPLYRGSLKAYDVSKLPQVSQLGTVALPISTASYGGKFLWVNSTTLLWIESHTHYYYYPTWGVYPIYIGNGVRETATWQFNYTLSSKKDLIAIDVTAPSAMKIASHIKVGLDDPWEVSDFFAANGSVYFSYKHLGFVFAQDDNVWRYTADELKNPNLFKLDPERVRLKNRHFLRIIDYGDPAAPAFRNTAVNVPGRLQGVSSSGQVLYTVGRQYNIGAQTTSDVTSTALHISALNGTKAHLVDQLPLTNGWQPFIINNDAIALLHPEGRQKFVPTADPKDGSWQGEYQENTNLSRLETWKIGVDGKLSKLDSLTLDREVALISVGNAWVVYGDSNAFRFIDGRNPENLIDRGARPYSGFTWPNFGNAAGDIDRGIWLPLGSYGVEAISLTQ